ncbi:MAG: hypothetical protein WCX80_02950, partial [Patescibacteria group bacterium]
IERVQNENSLFNSALKKLVNSSEKELDDFLKQKFEGKDENNVLHLISGGKKIIIKALDGKELIANAKKTFKSGIDSDFVNWELNTEGLATEETPTNVYEMVHDATFIQMFNSLPVNSEKLVMTQHQIINFCTMHASWLRQNDYATFFLTKKDWNAPASDNNLFVVLVRVDSDGLSVRVARFGFGHVWLAECRRRLVAPQLIS